MDKTTWTRVVDRSDQPCRYDTHVDSIQILAGDCTYLRYMLCLTRSWQSAFFERRAVTFIRIVGTHNTANEVILCNYDLKSE